MTSPSSWRGGSEAAVRSRGLDADEIHERLALLGAIDRGRVVFGAHTHGYRLGAALSEAEVAAREAKLGVALPADYRAFLLHVGAHGAGPYYGLSSFEDQDAWRAAHVAAGTPADPTSPFPRTRDTFPPSEAWPSLDGLVLLADQGCGRQSLLVVTGEARGEVWTAFDFGPGGPSDFGPGGLVPEARDFGSWYGAWLDRALFSWAKDRLRPLALNGGASEPERRGIDAARPLVHAYAAAPDVAPLQPGDSLRALGDLLLFDDRASDADAAYERAAALTPHDAAAQLHLDRARVRRKGARWAEALDEARRGLATDVRSLGRQHELHTEVERALLGLGRTSEAIAAMEARAAGDASYPSLHRMLARAQCDAGDLEGAHRTLLRAVERSIGCYASATEIGASLVAGLGMPRPSAERRVTEIYDAFVEELSATDPASAERLAARRPATGDA